MARIMGNPAASTWMLIISDFQCPYCKEYHDDRAPAIAREFVETGKVRVAYIHFPLQIHANAMPAAEASMCAGAQDQFWPYHDRLFETVGAWSASPDPAAAFEGIAAALGLNLELFRQCMLDDVMLPMIQADHQRASEAGAKSTPTFLIGNMMIPGVAPLDVFRTTINQALAGGMK